MGPDEMRRPRLPLDRSTADRLAAGELHPSDAPPGYERVAAALFEARRSPVGDADGRVDADLLGDLVLAIRSRPDPAPRRTALGERLTAKVGAVAAALVVSATGVAAAATGHLPGPAQDAVSDVVGAVGIDVPRSGGADAKARAKAKAEADDRGTGRVDATVTSEASRRGGDGGTTATTRRRGGSAQVGNPADAAAHGAAVSEAARTLEATGREVGAAVSEIARRDHGGGPPANPANPRNPAIPANPGSGGGTTTTTTGEAAATSTTLDDDLDESDGARSVPSNRVPGGPGVDGSGPNRGRG